MRVALLDLLFSWPPHGGADVDVYHVASELCRLGYDIHVFFMQENSGWERGRAVPSDLPFPSSRLDFSRDEFTAASVVSRFRDAMRHFGPDAVLLMQGYFLKTPLIHALSSYPIISRCYAHETACHKDILRFRDGAPCTRAYADTPEECRRCAAAHLSGQIRSASCTAWTQEYLAAKAWSADYYKHFITAMKQLRSVIITTERMREQVQGLCGNIHVIPHGVDGERFLPVSGKTESIKPVLFMPGRVEDPAKGFPVLMEAAGILAEKGFDFEVRATLPEGHSGPAWLHAVGKLDYETMPRAYQEADICVVPSVWEEPFGIVALEAMATGLPVCATRIGGLQDIVVHETTGFLFDSGDAVQLAARLEELLLEPEKRRSLGEAGRRRALKKYRWKDLVEIFYPALFVDL